MKQISFESKERICFAFVVRFIDVLHKAGVHTKSLREYITTAASLV